MAGYSSGSAVLERFNEAGLDYVEVKTGQGKTESLWRQIEALLREAYAARNVKRKPGRPKLGPGTGILTDARGREAILAEVDEVHGILAQINEGRLVTYIALAEGLDMSLETLYRIRKHWGWHRPNPIIPCHR